MGGDAPHINTDDMETSIAAYCTRTRFEGGQVLTVTPDRLRDLGLSTDQIVDIGIQHVQRTALPAYGVREQTFATALDKAKGVVGSPGYEVVSASLSDIGFEPGGSKSSSLERT